MKAPGFAGGWLLILAYHLNLFHEIDPKWTEENLLVVVDGVDDSDRDAFWDGFFWGAQTPATRLYLRMKPNLLAMATSPNLSRRQRTDVLAGMLLAGWGSRAEAGGERLISNSEMREALLHAGNEFRLHVLWLLETWAKLTFDPASLQNWRTLTPEFISDAWPL